jgi:hypothetical protein
MAMLSADLEEATSAPALLLLGRLRAVSPGAVEMPSNGRRAAVAPTVLAATAGVLQGRAHVHGLRRHDYQTMAGTFFFLEQTMAGTSGSPSAKLCCWYLSG